MNQSHNAKHIKLSNVRVDGGTQARVQLDWIAVDEYKKAMQDGEVFPPVVVFYDGADYWLADGFHRVDAAKRAGLDSVSADVREGTKDDAIIYACGANADHGVRRTTGDARRAICLLWEINERNGYGWDVKDFARLAATSPQWVRKVTEEKRAEAKAERDRLILEMAQAGYKQRPIGEAVGVGHQTVGRVLVQNESSFVLDQPTDRQASQAGLPKDKDETRSNGWFTLEEWNKLDESDQKRALVCTGEKKFNKQSGDNIEWARWSWNPITGCLHGCDYCYARDIANRFYPQGFAPSIVPERLTAPQNTPVPDVSGFTNLVDQIGYRNVFTCSMADLFGKWVPTAWIDSVLYQIESNPQWTFLLLTKFPLRMADFQFPKNTWIGTSVDHQWAVDRAEKAFGRIRDNGYDGVAWLSCEPMLERLTFKSIDLFDWVVIGGSSRSAKTEKYTPPLRDTMHLISQADQFGIPVYNKTNLGIDDDARIREYPKTAKGV